MKCIVAGPNVKIFGKSIHTLAKIGDELYFEPLDSGLAVRTVNSSRSAYAGFTFAPSFFLNYENRLSPPVDGVERFKGKIAVRSVLFVFKRLADLDKSVERCVIESDLAESRVVFRLQCKYGIVKTHKLAFIESETLVVNHDKSTASNLIKSHPLVLIDSVACFQGGVDEITLEPRFDQMIVRNHSDDPDPAKTTTVRFAVNPEEFDVYALKGGGGGGENGASTNDDPVGITFCLKELRALLSFAETYASTVAVYFDVAGEPIVFSIDSDPGFEAEFVLATTVEEVDSADADRSRPLPPPALNSSRTGGAPPPPVTRAVLTQRSQKTREPSPANGSVRDATTARAEDASSSASNRSIFLNSARTDAKRKATFLKLIGDDDDDDIPYNPRLTPAAPTDATEEPHEARTRPTDRPTEDSDEEVPTTPPSTPPSKKFRFLVGLGSQSSQNSLKTLTSQRTQRRESAVLAEDSEEDD